MAENTSGHYWDERVMEPDLTPAEKALRDQFVEQYLVDFDPFKAALRIGFLHSVAMTYAQQLMQEGYVLREIARRERIDPEDDKAQAARDRQLTLNTLRQAAQNGPYASRVAAAAKLASILGMDAPIKTQQEVTHRGGVMMVPAIANVDEWEREAQKSQEKLAEESRQI